MSFILSLLLAATVPTAADAKAAPAFQAYGKPAPAGKLSSADPRSIVAFLQKEGYRAKLITDDGARPYIESASNGATFFIFPQACEEDQACKNVMFQSSYDRNVESPVKVEQINDYNRAARWSRAYLDEDGNPVIELDVLFTDELVDEKMFGDALGLWDHSIGEFHKTIGW